MVLHGCKIRFYTVVRYGFVAQIGTRVQEIRRKMRGLVKNKGEIVANSEKCINFADAKEWRCQNKGNT